MRIVLTAVVLGALVAGADARDKADVTPPRAGSVQEASVLAVVIDPVTEQPTIVLEGKRDRRRFAMVIGVAEATGIALPLQGITPPRPLTHDLFLTMFGRMSVVLTRVVIDDFRDNTYFATVHYRVSEREMTLDSRPSDAIALAIRARVPVLVEDRVFERGSVPAPAAAPTKPAI